MILLLRQGRQGKGHAGHRPVLGLPFSHLPGLPPKRSSAERDIPQTQRMPWASRTCCCSAWDDDGCYSIGAGHTKLTDASDAKRFRVRHRRAVWNVGVLRVHVDVLFVSADDGPCLRCTSPHQLTQLLKYRPRTVRRWPSRIHVENQCCSLQTTHSDHDQGGQNPPSCDLSQNIFSSIHSISPKFRERSGNGQTWLNPKFE